MDDIQRFEASRRPCGVVHVPLVLLAIATAIPTGPALHAQDLEGRVVAAGYDTPLGGALVELVESRLVTMTDGEGGFAFRSVDLDVDSLRITRYGYETLTVWVEIDEADGSTFGLERAPVQLAGITTEVGFEERLSWIEERLDERVGEWPGVAKVAGREDIRPYDEEWHSDRWKFLHSGPLRVKWNGEFATGRTTWRLARTQSRLRGESAIWGLEDGFGIQPTTNGARGGTTWIDGYGAVSPQWWIDDRRLTREMFLRTPNEALCRVEVYTPQRYVEDPQPSPQVRGYTCSFLARVALGEAEICPVYQSGGLFMGGDGGATAQPVTRFVAARPPGMLEPIRLQRPGEEDTAGGYGNEPRACR